VSRAVPAAALFVLLMTFVGCGGRTGPRPLPVPGEPGHLFEINGRHLYLECFGTGTPTVLLEAGYGGDHRGWTEIEPRIAKTTRVCAYDRAGLGLSSVEAPEPRAPHDQLADLDDLLEDARIDPPYIAVGHSYGGALAWFFAKRRGDDVKGIVLVDAAHPDQTRRFRAVLPKDVPMDPQMSPENVRLSTALRQLGNPGFLGEKPLVVLTAGESQSDDHPRLAARLDRIWRNLHDDYARRSADSIHVIAKYSAHFIQTNLGQPDLVVQAIRELVSAARDDRPLRGCRRVFAPSAALCVSG
jgi:pimeloyl-ACP methyl ester carboxylesterase